MNFVNYEELALDEAKPRCRRYLKQNMREVKVYKIGEGSTVYQKRMCGPHVNIL
jgi:hypothetical protein